ncbi:MAG: prenyltransferase/squalene oxidase repeat-containing protein [Planctomycetota bacterium]|jgi:hypothetical protein
MRLKHDVVRTLLASGNEAVAYFTRRDLLGERVGPIADVWALPDAQRIVKKQHPGGYWKSRNRKARDYPNINYDLIETWKRFRHLVEKYAFTRKHPAAANAAEYLFSCQTEEGDIRGILANQHTIYYTGAILSLLVRAGYEDDPRVERAFEWLLEMRQDDGGWVGAPFQTLGLSGKEIHELTTLAQEPLRTHDRTKPFSHNWTGMVLRAFAHHPRYRRSEAARAAARLLASRFFLADAYTSYQHPDNWLRFDFPFWWNHLVAALDSVSRIAPEQNDQVHAALAWLVDHQQPDGLWKTSYSRIHKPPRDTAQDREVRLWLGLVIAGFMRRFGA